MNEPLVSVIMPAYNAQDYIEEAIRSVQAQTQQNWELLVLDDGSTDDTLAIAQRLARSDPRIRLLPNEENMGVAKTRNRGFSLSRGTYVALLDSDDVWLPEKLERQLEALQRTGADLSYCSYAIIDGAGEQAKADYIVPETVDFEGMLRENVICCSTALLRRELAVQHPFDPDFYHEDYVLWLQLLQSGCSFAGCTEQLAKWRYIPGSRSFNKLRSALHRWKIYRSCLKLPFLKSVRIFADYMLAGLRKYK